MTYPAPGAPALAARADALLGEGRGRGNTDWGLDHGTWCVLVAMYPEADIPVAQLSLDRRAPPAEHLEIARRLAPLRDEGVLVMGSGNVTHNLRHAMTQMRAGRSETPMWAERLDRDVAQAFEQHDAEALTHFLDTEHGRLSHPSPDHYLPLIYAAGVMQDADDVAFSSDVFDAGSLSMRNVIVGAI